MEVSRNFVDIIYFLLSSRHLEIEEANGHVNEFLEKHGALILEDSEETVLCEEAKENIFVNIISIEERRESLVFEGPLNNILSNQEDIFYDVYTHDTDEFSDCLL